MKYTKILTLFCSLFPALAGMPALSMENDIVKQGAYIGGLVVGRACVGYAAFMLDTLIHESGHALTGYLTGVKPEHIHLNDSPSSRENPLINTPFISVNSLIPGNGATLYKTKPSPDKTAYIALAGPLTGLAAIAVIWPFAKNNDTGKFLCKALALLNIKQLIPTPHVWKMLSDEGFPGIGIERDGDQAWGVLGKKYLSEKMTDEIKRFFEPGRIGDLTHTLADLGITILPLYFLARTVLHK